MLSIKQYVKIPSLEKIEGQIQLLEEAIKSDPTLGIMFYNDLGLILHNTKQHSRADEMFKVNNFDTIWSCLESSKCFW